MLRTQQIIEQLLVKGDGRFRVAQTKHIVKARTQSVLTSLQLFGVGFARALHPYGNCGIVLVGPLVPCLRPRHTASSNLSASPFRTMLICFVKELCHLSGQTLRCQADPGTQGSIRRKDPLLQQPLIPTKKNVALVL